MENIEKIKEQISQYQDIKQDAESITEDFAKTSEGRQQIKTLSQRLISVHGTGDYIEHHLSHCKKTELLNYVKIFAERLLNSSIDLGVMLYNNYTEKEKKELEAFNSPESILTRALDSDKAKFLGEGEWVKDTAYQVYEVEDRYFAVIVSGHSNKEIVDNTTVEITKEEISQYV